MSVRVNKPEPESDKIIINEIIFFVNGSGNRLLVIQIQGIRSDTDQRRLKFKPYERIPNTPHLAEEVVYSLGRWDQLNTAAQVMTRSDKCTL